MANVFLDERTGRIMPLRTNGVLYITLLLTAFVVPQAARAGFTLGDAANFGVLYEGTGGNTLNFSNGSITGNIGIGGTGKYADAGGCAGQCAINGLIEFSAANDNTGNQFKPNAGTTYTPALAPAVNPLYSRANVATDLTMLNNLSSMLGGETGTPLAISSGGSINASSGMLDGSGNYVFTATSDNFPNGTFTINGTASQFVVINVPMAFNEHGIIVLTGGITSDQVLFNVTGSGNALDINTNGLTTTGTFLDPNGAISLTHAVLDGRVFGGDSTNLQIVSGGHLEAPPTPAVPEPAHTVFALGLTMAIALVVRRRKSLQRERLNA